MDLDYATRVKFPFVFVDEFQDTNPLQTMLIKLIGCKSTVIWTIGDVAQFIYSFQGAKPSQFLALNVGGDRTLNEYAISGNRRSTTNIINFCNYLRKADSTVIQHSEKCYDSAEEKQLAESTKIHIISGEAASVKQLINSMSCSAYSHVGSSVFLYTGYQQRSRKMFESNLQCLLYISN